MANLLLKSGSFAGTQHKVTSNGYLIKYDRGSNREGLAEVLTSRFLDTCNIPVNHIRYVPYKDEIGVGCASRVNSDMYNSGGSLVHYMQRVIGAQWSVRYSNLEPVQAYELLLKDLSNVPNAAEYLTYLQLIDTIVMNTDRHWNNINLIQGKNGKFCFSPLFDFGASLAVAAMPEESLEMCIAIFRKSCCWLVPNHFGALCITSSFHPYKLTFKKDTIRVSDLSRIYPEGIVKRATGVIEYNLKQLGINTKFRYI